MPKLIDITNCRFGKWTVLHKFNNPNKQDKRNLWTCRCDCGTIRNIDSFTLRSGGSKSCGCSKDGHSKTRLYSIWIGIKDRTSCKDRPRAKDYIGRGITMCEEWKSWDSFKNWAINNGYGDNLTIDRIDVEGNYEPSNCRFVNSLVQANNTRRNIRVYYKGTLRSIGELAREFCINYRTLHNRIVRGGWKVEDAVNTNVNGREFINGRKVEKCNKDGIHICYYKSIEEARKENKCGRHISEVCLGKRKSCGGYIWKYV